MNYEVITKKGGKLTATNHGMTVVVEGQYGTLTIKKRQFETAGQTLRRQYPDCQIYPIVDKPTRPPEVEHDPLLGLIEDYAVHQDNRRFSDETKALMAKILDEDLGKEFIPE